MLRMLRSPRASSTAHGNSIWISAGRLDTLPTYASMDSNNQSEAHRLVSELQEKGWHSFAFRLDTGSEASIRSYNVAALLDHLPGIDVLRALLGTGNGTHTLPTNLKGITAKQLFNKE